ncbi:hypothetical protein QAD02_010363 [Eretmocerus hayati]|uniref:Uncharacterized protein n=1 Tax=Eretmocerus hayati TaxID=131215 RepID=A0ACC2NGI3_9HYME|nr:hypothetical protein QAD02_010363 [Eretmocerus hayati]
MASNSSESDDGMAELFHKLESNKLSDVEEIKKVFHDHFLSTKDNWVVNGLFDYYLSTDSLRAVEILSGVREPHDKHLFDKLCDSLIAKPSNNAQRVKTLTLLSHITRRQPTWLHKLANHALFKQLLHLLKVEEDIVLLMSALLLLIILLPMLPVALIPYLHEIFEVFARIVSYHYHRFPSFSMINVPTSTSLLLNVHDSNHVNQIYVLHLQVGLHNLFHRLYAMYPCNFVMFLKQQLLQRDQLPIFKKIISPMLDSVRMHPLLITMSKESEISSSRWKKMEHHDILAECSKFSLYEPSNRDEAIPFTNMRFTPISEYSCPYTPVSNVGDFPIMEPSFDLLFNGTQENFWSPSMVVGATSPPPSNSLQVTPLSHLEAKSLPSTPGGTTVNIRPRTSPPEAAIEATPETTPVKDLRGSSGRQMPKGSGAVRALAGLSDNGGLISSRSTTPEPYLLLQQLSADGTTSSTSILDRKLGKIVAERQSAARLEQLHQQHTITSSPQLSVDEPSTLDAQSQSNGRVDPWQHQQQLDDQEVSDIVSSSKVAPTHSKTTSVRNEQVPTSSGQKAELALTLSTEILAERQFETISITDTIQQNKPVVNKSEEKKPSNDDISQMDKDNERRRRFHQRLIQNTFVPVTNAIHNSGTSDAAVQTCSTLPYEYLLYEVLEQRSARNTPAISLTSERDTASSIFTEARLSPSAMLERYIELCARSGNGVVHQPSDSDISKSKQSVGTTKRAKNEDEAENGLNQNHQQHDDNSEPTGHWNDFNRANQQFQLMQMQLQFERQRREVHAERNRRLLGKLRDSRASEEQISSLSNSLKLAQNEIDTLKSQLSSSKMTMQSNENKLMENVRMWQTKCKEEEQKNLTTKSKVEHLEEELRNEKKKVAESEKQIRATEAALFEVAHQLKEALRVANQSEDLKRLLDSIQKRFLLFGEAHMRIQERIAGPVYMVKQEALHIQKSWTEELTNLRRQLDAQTLQFESVKSRLAECEYKDARKETQLVEQQRLLMESKEKHSAELEAVDSKYRAQLEINLLLESRVLELRGELEQAQNAGTSNTAQSLASSISPKERSPPLSASLASSSEGSLAFIHSAMHDYCDPLGEIANLQAIVEPADVDEQR